MKMATNQLMTEICKVLELDPSAVRRITIDWRPQEVATIRIEHFVDSMWAERMAEILAMGMVKKASIVMRFLNMLYRVRLRLRSEIRREQIRQEKIRGMNHD